MKKFLKITGISLLSLLLLLTVVVGGALAYVFSPDKLTRLVDKYAGDFLQCDYHIDRVEPTFFSTFPHFGLGIDGLLLRRNDFEPDTLLWVDRLRAGLDIKAFLKHRQLLLDDIYMNGLVCHVHINAQGHGNYEVFATDTTKVQDSESHGLVLPFDRIDLDKLSFTDMLLTFTSDADTLRAEFRDMSLNARIKYQDDEMKGRLQWKVPSLYASQGENVWLDRKALSLDVPFQARLDRDFAQINLKEAALELEKLLLQVDGQAGYSFDQGSVQTNLDFRLGRGLEPVDTYLGLLPASMISLPDELSVDGRLALSGHIQGTMVDSLMPGVDVLLQLADASARYEGLPELTDVEALLRAHVDMNRRSASELVVEKLSLRANESRLQANGSVSDLLSDDRLLKLEASLTALLPAWKQFFPENLTINSGKLDADVTLEATQPQLLAADLSKIAMNGRFTVRNLEAAYDTILLNLPSAKLTAGLRQHRTKPIFLHLAKATDISVAMGDNLEASLQGAGLDLYVSDVIKRLDKVNVDGQLSADHLSAGMDDMGGELRQADCLFDAVLNLQDSTAVPLVKAQLTAGGLDGHAAELIASLQQPQVEIALQPQAGDASQMQVALKYRNEALSLEMPDTKLTSDRLSVSADLRQDKSADELLLQWNPQASFNCQNGYCSLSAISQEIRVPQVSFDYHDDHLVIAQSSVQLGNSDFHLSGEVRQLAEYLKNAALLKGELYFVSHHTDVNEILQLTSGLGSDSTDLVITPEEQAELDSVSAEEPHPFIVPKGIDLILHTSVEEAVIGSQTAKNLGGNIYVRDGVLVLEEMGFICEAAKLQLTAVYRSPRPNHLYVGLDYHMVDIQIEELLEMIPQVDDVLPMLRSFKGGAQFHLAAETYLNARYDLKKSTLRGAASLAGEDLVLLDGEQFSEIAKILMFSKKTENKIDTIQAELTVFRNEVDIYPLQVSMDKYRAIVAGRHNLDMTFNYHVSLVRPLKIGVNIGGTLDKLRIRPGKCLYTDQYRPSRQHVVEQQQLNLRNIIRETLIKDL